MFPNSLLEHIDNSTPKVNPSVANGLVAEHLNYVEQYVDSVFRSAAIGFPQGMVYHGCKRCTPIEEYNEAIKKKGNKSVFDVAKSDVYLMEYLFSYKDELMPDGSKYIKKYLYLPYVGPGGAIHLGGSRFVISPVLADKVISIGINSVFVRLLKAKLTFNRTPHHYIANGERESIQVAWSEIYNKKAGGPTLKPSVKANCTMLHYLMCKYGFKESFKQFANCDAILGDETTITNENYPSENWVICESTRMKPKGFGKNYYNHTNLRIAIAKHEYTPTVKNFIASFFYIADHFPSRIRPEYVENTRLWMTLLGLLIWSDSVSEGKLHADVSDHIASLDEYVDALVNDKLREIGFPCANIYQLFALVITKFDEWLLTSDDRVNTMYDKELSVLYYVCYDLIESIFRLYFKLKAAGKKDLNIKKIAGIMSIHLKPGIIYKLTREHGEVTTTSTPSDNKFFKITCLLVPQSSAGRARKKKDRVAISDPAKRLHVSIAEIGSCCALPKSEPSGRSRISPFLNISPTGLVNRNERYRDLLDNIQQKIRR
jgi:hypothetical protein